MSPLVYHRVQLFRCYGFGQRIGVLLNCRDNELDEDRRTKAPGRVLPDLIGHFSAKPVFTISKGIDK